MAKVKCSQCGYFKANCSGCKCVRYTIDVEKDTICVDCDELNCSDEQQMIA